MRRALLASVLVLLGSLAFADDQCVRLFLEAKEEFRLAQYEKALASLEMAFTSAPLLTGRAGYGRMGGEREVSVAVPEQPGFTWSWLSRQRGQWEQTRAIAPAATRASGAGPLQLCEGWLKLSRETPPEGSDNHGA